MSLYEKWTELVESHQTQESLKHFWKDYFDQEKNNYDKFFPNRIGRLKAP